MVTAHCRPQGHTWPRVVTSGDTVAVALGIMGDGSLARKAEEGTIEIRQIIKACFRLTSNLVQVPILMFRTLHCKGCPTDKWPCIASREKNPIFVWTRPNYQPWPRSSASADGWGEGITSSSSSSGNLLYNNTRGKYWSGINTSTVLVVWNRMSRFSLAILDDDGELSLCQTYLCSLLYHLPWPEYF